MSSVNRRQRRPLPLVDRDGKGTPALARFVEENAPSGGGGAAWTAATANLPAGAGVYDFEQTVTAASVTGTSKIALMLDHAADTDENEPEFIDLANMTAFPGTGSFTLSMTFREPHSGPIKFFYQVN